MGNNIYIRLITMWKNTPEQVKRLTIILVIILASLIIVQKLLIPDDFGKSQEAHIILRVVDNGIPNLVDYKRIIIKHTSNN